ncbi:hypothetical protein ACLOJK_038157 [Asimina triloba]
MGEEGVGDFASKMISELLILVGSLGAYVIEKVNEAIFPAGSETRPKQLDHWIHVAAPWLVGLLLLWTIYSCCGCCGNSKKTTKMMKAPGRSYRMPRHVFESNPRSHFRDLRD